MLATSNAAAVAFTRSGDLATGEFQGVIVIQRYGDLLRAEELLAAD